MCYGLVINVLRCAFLLMSRSSV
uniref:Uncharacterized protein n=1 Tax=Anguilla anguilla TaxID=7936 RepID=A0A0E9RPW1_ANGAN